MSYHINSDEELITLRLSGVVDLVETLELVKSLLGDPAYDPNLPQLIDCRGIRPNVQRDPLNRFIEFLEQQYRPNVNASIAIVVDETLGTEQTAGMYWLSCGLDSAELFDDYDQALRWLIKREFYHSSARPLS